MDLSGLRQEMSIGDRATGAIRNTDSFDSMFAGIVAQELANPTKQPEIPFKGTINNHLPFDEIPIVPYKSLKEMYIEWVVPQIEYIKDALKSCYGDEYQFEVTKNSSFLLWLSRNNGISEQDNKSKLGTYKRGIIDSDIKSMCAYTIIIHYPQLEITNSRGGKQVMNDMYIKIQLNPFLTGLYNTYFMGMRTTYTFAEFSSQYNFSHLHSSPSSFVWDYFCLGDTDFAIMSRSLAVEFEANKFELFLHQLGSYLSWESLEGGPYKKIGEIHASGSSSEVSISATDKLIYYNRYLELGHVPTIEIKSNPYQYCVNVVIDDSLREAITGVTEDKHKQYWNASTKVATNRVINNRRDQIEDYKRRYNKVLFKFNGKDIKFEINDLKEEKDDDKAKIAHESIIKYIIDKLNVTLNKNIKDEYSSKYKRGVSLVG